MLSRSTDREQGIGNREKGIGNREQGRENLIPHPSSLIPSRRGLTTPELLVTVLILAILMLAAFSLFKSSWQSYDNLVWQTKVNMEARQSLDDICDMLRTSGTNLDMIRPNISTAAEAQVDPTSTASKLVFLPVGFPYFTYRAQQSNSDHISYLTRMQGANLNSRHKVGQFIKSVQFEYEYRLPSTSDSDPVWHFQRVSNPQNPQAAAYLATTVYVTVTAEAQPYGNDGPTYRRVMTGAVRLRGPHGLTMPPAQYSNVPELPDANE